MIGTKLFSFQPKRHDAKHFPVTAEIAVMNRIAVALAADSAATAPALNSKIFNSADKLFQLSSWNPVGVMVYGVSTFMGIPWETVIKVFRRTHSASHPNLKNYADDLLRFLTSKELLSDQHIEDYFLGTIAQNVDLIRKAIESTHKQNPAVPVEQVAISLEQNIRKLALIPGASLQTAVDLRNKFGTQIDAAISGLFAGNDPGQPVREKIREIFCLVSVSQSPPQGNWPNQSGLVIAGFGEAELFPSVLPFTVRSVLPSRLLQYGELLPASVNLKETNAQIYPFAQAEMVHSFMTGIDPAFSSLIVSGVDKLLKQLATELGGPLKSLPSEELIIDLCVTD